MNREIKFRAWDKDSERMIDEPYHFEQSEDKYWCYEGWRDLEDGIRHDCELMQFTGLLDKNGKEIYEGDILSRRGMEDGEVRYEKGVWIIFSETSSAIWKQELHNHYHHTEIIGNIYQKI